MDAMTSEITLSVIRVASGVFFAASGWNKIMRPDRHATIAKTMRDDHVPFPQVMEWFVPTHELLCGLMLSVGLFSTFNALVLGFICLMACKAEAQARVDAYKPINGLDRVDDYLYLPEVLYGLLLCVTIFVGHGIFAIDTLI